MTALRIQLSSVTNFEILALFLKRLFLKHGSVIETPRPKAAENHFRTKTVANKLNPVGEIPGVKKDDLLVLPCKMYIDICSVVI